MPVDETAEYEILCKLTGDRAEADTDDAALIAAWELVEDAHRAVPAQGRLEAARKSLYITRDGSYQGTLTELARLGHRSVAAFERSEYVALGARGSRAQQVARGNA